MHCSVQLSLTVVDHVISGLPLPSFPTDQRNRLIQLVGSCLAPEGSFRQLTHMPWVYQRLYQGYFDEVRFNLVSLNFPPGGIYVCRGLRKQPPGAVK